MNRPQDDKKRLADALRRMTGAPPPEPPAEPLPKPQRPAQSDAPKPAARIRPAFPTISKAEPEPVQHFEQAQVEDDRVSMLAPTPQDMLSRRQTAARQSQLKSQSQTLNTRRTIVPILLTLGVMLPILGGLWFLTDEDSPFRTLSVYVPVALILLGSMLLIVGILNVLYLSHALKHQS